MVGEHAVRLQELTAFNPRAQFFHQLRIESTCAIARVHHDVQPQQRLGHIRTQSAADAVGKLLLIRRQERLLDNRACQRGVFGFERARRFEQFLHHVAFHAAFRQEELQSILVIRVMACGNHNRAIRLETGRDDAHVHCRGRAHAKIQHGRARFAHTLRRRVQQRRAGNAAVTPNGNRHLRHRLADMLRHIARERHAKTHGHMLRQRGILAHRHAAYV